MTYNVIALIILPRQRIRFWNAGFCLVCARDKIRVSVTHELFASADDAKSFFVSEESDVSQEQWNDCCWEVSQIASNT